MAVLAFGFRILVYPVRMTKWYYVNECKIRKYVNGLFGRKTEELSELDDAAQYPFKEFSFEVLIVFDEGKYKQQVVNISIAHYLR